MEEIKGIKYNSAQAKEKQREYCKEHSLPHFAPYDGICFSCRQNIYRPIEHKGYVTGISVERAGKELITGCPHCNRTYCD